MSSFEVVLVRGFNVSKYRYPLRKLRETFAESFNKDCEPPKVKWEWRDLLVNNNAACLILNGKKPAGYAKFFSPQLGCYDFWIESLYNDPDYSEEDVKSLIIKKLLAYAKLLSLKTEQPIRIRYMSDPYRIKEKKLLQNLGFKIISNPVKVRGGYDPDSVILYKIEMAPK